MGLASWTIDQVCDALDVEVEEVVGEKRSLKHRSVNARMLCAVVFNRVGIPQSEIAHHLGLDPHSVAHALKRADHLLRFRTGHRMVVENVMERVQRGEWQQSESD